MPEENKKELIDVGDSDEKTTEINLDEQQPKKEAVEEKIEVEQVEAKEEKPVEEKKEEKKEDELEKYSEGVQKRIAKLTRKMREAERQREEAVNYAQVAKQDKEVLETKLSRLDKSYVSEFENRVKTNMDAARQALKVAIEAGDVDGQVSAQENIARLSSDAVRLGQLKAVEEQKSEKRVNINPQRKVQDQYGNVPTDPKAEDWASNNSWFGNDSAMTYTAFDIHKKLVEEEGYDPKTNEYYAEVDKRIRLEFPHKFDSIDGSTTERTKPVQNVASAKRSAPQGRKKTVKLTPSQVAIAKRLGVPLEDYAKQVKITEGV